MKPATLSKVFVAMSGGVDSSVAAALLKERGFSVVGCHIKCYNIDGCSERDAEDARRVAEQLGIPFYVFDLEQEYKDRVVHYMITEYAAGRTPNPDVMCNKHIKFGAFLKKALELGTDYIATGHYLRLLKSQIPNPKSQINSKNQNPKLKTIYKIYQAKDPNKDQSYFLWTLTQDQLKHCLFPIGEYTKPEVRRLAKSFGLLTADKKDSQGICFLGKVTLVDFLKQYIPERPGVMFNTSGAAIGAHPGVHFYTIGQRHGLGLGGLSRPAYVAEKDMDANTVVVAEGQTNPALYRKKIQLRNINFIIPHSSFTIPVLARVRYRQPLASAALQLTAYGLKLIFDTPQKFVAPGQSAVFYNKEGELLGGGIIA